MSEKKIVVKLKYGASASSHQGSYSPNTPIEYDWNYKRIAIVLIGLIVLGGLAYRLLPGSPSPETTNGTGDIDFISESVTLEKQQPLNRSLDPDRQVTIAQPDKNSGTSLKKGPVSTENETVDLQADTDSGDLTETSQPQSEKSESESVVPSRATLQAEEAIDKSESLVSPNIVRARFAWGIKDKEPAGAIQSPAILQRGDSVTLYFFSEFKNMDGQTIRHEWSHDGKVKVTKDFDIAGSRWRVFSSKQLNSELLGEWKVVIRAPDGKNLGEYILKVLEPVQR